MSKANGRTSKKRNAKASKPTGAKIENAQAGIGGGGNAVYPGIPFTQSVATMDPLFNNLRWYLVSNNRQLLNELYVEIGLVSTIVDVPVDDGLRGGVEIKSQQLDEDQIEELKTALDRDDDLTTVGTAAKWNRLFGGGGILILTNQNPETPLAIAKIRPNDNVEFRAVDMWELFWDEQNTEGYDPSNQTDEFEFYSYYGIRVHRSRVLRLKGLTPPSFIRPKLRGWGLSVVEILVRSINQYLRATDVAYELLDEMKVDIYKIKNLVNTLLSNTASEQIQRRVAQMNYTKNFQNAIVMDGEDEYDQKQVSFAGFGDAMQQIRMQVASDMRMPMLKLFGTPATGLNADDEDSLEVYNSMVESQVRNKLKYDILRLLEIKCQILFGFVPDDMTIDFAPLRVMSAEQQENVKTQKFARALQAMQASLLTAEEFRDICNKGDLFDIKLDTDLVTMDEHMEAHAQVPEPAPGAVATGGEDEDQATDKDASTEPVATNPAADAVDTRKPRAMANDFKEEDHPRADDGKFGEGGGKGSVGKSRETASGFSAPDSLTPEQETARDYYKSHIGFKEMNKTLKAGEAETPEIKALDEAIAASTLTKDMTVYRGMYGIKAIHDLGEGGVGTAIEMGTYWSTSKDPRVAGHFVDQASDSALFEIRLKAGQKAFDFEDEKEQEILLPHGQTYKVVGYVPPASKTKPPTYILEVVDKVANSYWMYENSERFDAASYEADGGADTMDSRRAPFFDRDKAKHKDIWDKAAAQAGPDDWKYTVWLYQKWGGVFNDGDESASAPSMITGGV